MLVMYIYFSLNLFAFLKHGKVAPLQQLTGPAWGVILVIL